MQTGREALRYTAPDRPAAGDSAEQREVALAAVFSLYRRAAPIAIAAALCLMPPADGPRAGPTPAPGAPASAAAPEAAGGASEAAPLALAEGTTETLTTAGAWTATSAIIYGQPECFVRGEPDAQSIAKEARDWPPSITITHRPAEGVHGEVTIDPGVALGMSAPATAKVGDHSFNLAVEGTSQRLLLPIDLADERRLVATLRSGAFLDVAATAADGRPVLDRYDLAGIAEALDAIDKACPP